MAFYEYCAHSEVAELERLGRKTSIVNGGDDGERDARPGPSGPPTPCRCATTTCAASERSTSR
jgi:hypothetical protein